MGKRYADGVGELGARELALWARVGSHQNAGRYESDPNHPSAGGISQLAKTRSRVQVPRNFPINHTVASAE